jgi:hypothetical protein
MSKQPETYAYTNEHMRVYIVYTCSIWSTLSCIQDKYLLQLLLIQSMQKQSISDQSKQLDQGKSEKKSITTATQCSSCYRYYP